MCLCVCVCAHAVRFCLRLSCDRLYHSTCKNSTPPPVSKEEAGRGWNSRSKSSAEGAKLKTLSSRDTLSLYIHHVFSLWFSFAGCCTTIYIYTRIYAALLFRSLACIYFSPLLSHFFESSAASHKVTRGRLLLARFPSNLNTHLHSTAHFAFLAPVIEFCTS